MDRRIAAGVTWFKRKPRDRSERRSTTASKTRETGNQPRQDGRQRRHEPTAILLAIRTEKSGFEYKTEEAMLLEIMLLLALLVGVPVIVGHIIHKGSQDGR